MLFFLGKLPSGTRCRNTEDEHNRGVFFSPVFYSRLWSFFIFTVLFIHSIFVFLLSTVPQHPATPLLSNSLHLCAN